MRIASFDEVKSLEKGQPVTGVSGVISFVGKSEMKDGNYGPYSLQRIAIKMQGGELNVTLQNRDTVEQSSKGKKIWITQGKDGKGQWAGVKADHFTMTQGERAGQVRYGVSVNNVAEISWEDPGSGSESNPPPQRQAAQSQQQQATATQRQQNAPLDLRSVKLKAARDMIATDICIKAALRVLANNSAGISALCGENPSTRDVIALANCLMIQGQREYRFDGLGTNWDAYVGAQGEQQQARQAPPQRTPPPQEDPPAETGDAPPDDDDVPF